MHRHLCAPKPTEGVLRRACVLVVDDRIENRNSTRSFLAWEGYATQEADSVIEALEQIQATAVDLVLTDVRIQQDDDGLELLRKIKASWPAIPVILYTGFGSIRDAVVATRRGAA